MGTAPERMDCDESWTPFLSRSTTHYLGDNWCPELPGRRKPHAGDSSPPSQECPGELVNQDQKREAKLPRGVRASIPRASTSPGASGHAETLPLLPASPVTPTRQHPPTQEGSQAHGRKNASVHSRPAGVTTRCPVLPVRQQGPCLMSPWTKDMWREGQPSGGFRGAGMAENTGRCRIPTVELHKP